MNDEISKHLFAFGVTAVAIGLLIVHAIHSVAAELEKLRDAVRKSKDDDIDL